MPRKRTTRLSLRNGVYYADFRDYQHVGGKRELLRPNPAIARGTADLDVASALLAHRTQELESLRRAGGISGTPAVAAPPPDAMRLERYANYHLEQKAQEGVSVGHLVNVQRALEAAIAFLGADRLLTSITSRDSLQYLTHLRQQTGQRGKYSAHTIRGYHFSLSNLFTRAELEGLVVKNPLQPVTKIRGRRRPLPAPPRSTTAFLEVPEAALLLETSRTIRLRRSDLALPYLYPLLATYLLTGGRRAEVLGLEVADIRFDLELVHFRPNPWRDSLKTEGSQRTVPLWPQLAVILRDYLNQRLTHEVFAGLRPCRLLFPVLVNGQEQMLKDFRKAVQQVEAALAWTVGRVTPNVFRHTYCAARLQTLDGGAPVAPFTVERELGHGGPRLVREVYGHLGKVRHRAEAVEYRLEPETFVPGIGTEIGQPLS